MKKFSSSTASIFALKNLPEVEKAALFSRYSRTDLGLRELYEKEFQGDEDRANNFFERVLDGYGDDSVAELGGAHLAMENISIIATKIIEDGRIGAAYLEKSTRYVDFGKKNAFGDYAFYLPREITAISIDMEGIYRKACAMLFDAYVELLPLVRTQLDMETEWDWEAGISEEAHNRAIRAQAFDICRGLLPASTLTNVGIYANGRFFETLLMKLMNHPLSEMQQIGSGSRTALVDVIPSLVRRADHSHRHYEAYATYHDQLRDEVKSLIVFGHDPKPSKNSLGATLIDFDIEAEWKVLAAVLYEGMHRRSLSDFWDTVASYSKVHIKDNFEKLSFLRTDRRHKLPRGLEHADYTFEIIADYGVYRDLHRHRILTHQRQHVGCDLGFVISPELERSEWQGIKDVYIGAMEQARATWGELCDFVPLEVAQYVVPLAYNIRWLMKANLREWIWITELRTVPQGHPNYRKIAQQIYCEIVRVHPAFEPFFKFVNMVGYDLGRSQAEQRQEK